MSFSVSGKTAIVTGAAAGIGLAIARHLLDKGANVIFADIDEARLEAEVGDEARAEGPIRMFAGDLTEKLTIANLLSATFDAFDRLDAVLALQLGLLRYVDLRVAAMPRLGDGPAIEPPAEPADVEAEASRLDA